ncbi:MAG: UDP-N-acetylmuramate--L-alanine ligase [Pseudomonadota bacterium]|nr:UDP-N-acetylmuramate--L-alanine ligase [Pseudomonadota bacterium]
MFEKHNIHFIGIGGIGMSAIAEILHRKGFKITGSDLSKNLITRKLKKKGIQVFNKHLSRNIKDADIVVYSSAIKEKNIEFQAAKKRRIPLYSRAMMLAEVMRIKPSITVAGSHGKTTTTSLISSILEHSGYDPTIINGGIINSINANAKLGKGKWIVAEADESDGSFKMLPSTVGVINNIDLEHLDFYKNIDDIKDSFIEYAKNIPFYGFISINIDDKNVEDIQKSIRLKKIYTFGLSNKADFCAKNIKIIKKKGKFYSCFDVVIKIGKKRVLKNLMTPLLGKHNVLNTLCSYSVAKGLKVPDYKIKNALRNFMGVKRRFSILYNDSKNMIIDDYAHHPNEIRTTLNALKCITKKKLITIFEPHRYSRIDGMINEFVECFKEADTIFIMPIYTAGEKKIKRIDNFYLCKLMKKKYFNKLVEPISKTNSLYKRLKEVILPDDNVIFLGAGNSSKVANNFSKLYIKNAK